MLGFFRALKLLSKALVDFFNIHLHNLIGCPNLSQQPLFVNPLGSLLRRLDTFSTFLRERGYHRAVLQAQCISHYAVDLVIFLHSA